MKGSNKLKGNHKKKINTIVCGYDKNNTPKIIQIKLCKLEVRKNSIQDITY